MNAHRKANATGRDSGKFVRRHRHKIDGPFVPHTLAMLESPAYRALSLSELRVLARLEIEHLRNGGAENGNLVVTFAQFVQHDVHKDAVAPSLRVLAALGFVVVEERGRGGNAEHRRASRYRLTYIPANGVKASDDWRNVGTMTEASQIAEAARARVKNQKAAPENRSVSPPETVGEMKGFRPRNPEQMPTPETGGTFYISEEDAPR